MKKINIAVFVISILLSACSTMQSIPVENRTYNYNADYLTTFKACVTVCNDNAYPIAMADKELGIINTDWKMNDGTSQFFMGNVKLKMNFSLSKLNETSTKVVVTMTGVQNGAALTMSEGQVKDTYANIFIAIQKRIDNN